ncbi:YEATS domain-containing protein 2 [Bacillus rossius redtenbacheri]|uniref:YEATS domain-containing protein 2 n=1 Tax=Bacillus rossius redtenbacheri TaxID=93214 RepID=UPI002FDCCD5B
MACLKRFLDGQDPDYEDSAPNEAKRLRLLEQNAKADVSQRVCAIVEREFGKELGSKEREAVCIQERLHHAQKTLHLLRYAIVRNYYTRSESQQSSQQTHIHPAVKKLIGKQPQHPFLGQLEQRPSKYRQASSVALKSEPPDPESPGLGAGPETRVTKVPRYVPPKPDETKLQPQIGLSRGLRHKVKKRLVIGNISKWIPVDSREDSASHKWMIYVRGPREAPDVSGFVSKVRFFLHPSFRPNDVVEVTSPPFHLSRRGWGEFPARVQVHFRHPLNKPVDLLHHLKLDSSYTGLQRLGAETVVDIWLYVIPTPLSCAPGEGNCSDEQVGDARLPSTDETGPTAERASPLGRGNVSGAELHSPYTCAQGGNACVKEESGIESCGSSDASEPSFCKVEPQTREEEIPLHSAAGRSDCNVTIKEEPLDSDAETNCGNLAKDVFADCGIKLETVEEEILVDDTLERCVGIKQFENKLEVDGPSENGPENFDDKPEFISTMFDHDYFSCAKPPRREEKRSKVVNEGNSTKMCNGSDNNVPFSVMNGVREHDVNDFPETKTSSVDSSLLITNPVEHPVGKVATSNSSTCAGAAKVAPDVQSVDVSRRAGTRVKCMDSSGNVFYITLSGTRSNSSKPEKPSTAAVRPRLPCVTRTGCSTATVPDNSAAAVPQLPVSGGRDTCSVPSGTAIPTLSRSSANIACHVVNNAVRDSKSLLSNSSLPPARSASDVKNVQVADGSVGSVQTMTSKKVVLVTKQAPPAGTQPGRGQTVLLLRNGQCYVVKQPQQQAAVFKMPAAGVSSGPQPKPGCSLLKTRVTNGQALPPLAPIARPGAKKADRKMVVLNRAHGPITAATPPRTSHHEEALKAAVEACRFPTQTLCVRWLLRHLPLVSRLASDRAFRAVHPYAAPSHGAFLAWNIGKQRAAEWLRAKKVQKLLLQLQQLQLSCAKDVWSTRAIVEWARRHGYTPVSQHGGDSGGPKTHELPCAVPEGGSTLSEPMQVLEWLETSGSATLRADDDVEIDVVGLPAPAPIARPAAGAEPWRGGEGMEHDPTVEASCALLGEEVRRLGFKMAAEPVAPGILYPAAERVLLEAMKSLAEDLLRRALCRAWVRNSNRPPETVMACDVVEALLGRPEFDMFTNFGLGVQATDTG